MDSKEALLPREAKPASMKRDEEYSFVAAPQQFSFSAPNCEVGGISIGEADACEASDVCLEFDEKALLSVQ